jgi:S-adenosylmethionine synthetase
LAYSIGVAEPVMALAEVTMTDGSQHFQTVSGYDLTPAGIVQLLDLKKPQFEQVAEWGSFGNDFIWDR